MRAPELCMPYFWAMCDRPEAWAVWAALLQALLAGAAIYFAALFAVRQERRVVARRTKVFLELIKQASSQAGTLKTFFMNLKGEESRQSYNAGKRKAFERYAEILRSVPLENIVDSRLLSPLYGAAESCEEIARLLSQEHANGSAGMKIWFEQLNNARDRLGRCFTAAVVVHSKYDPESILEMSNRLRQKFLSWVRGALH